jgi:glucokinase
MSETRVLRPFPFTPAPQIVADIGGTNTRVALADHGVLRAGSIARFRNADWADLFTILRKYMADTATPDSAGVCVAVAGPVQDGVTRMTNLDWVIDEAGLREAAQAPVAVILNDMQAQGHALPALPGAHLRDILPGAAGARGTKLVVGLGTGFNAAPVFEMGAGVFVPPAEAGHIHLPRHGVREEALAEHLAGLHGIASVEEVLSGRGLVALHHWLHRADLEAGALLEAIAAGDAAALETGRMFITLLGRTLATLALTNLPWGGIYLIGGVARAFAPHMADLGLGAAMGEMGRFSEVVRRMPVRVVEDDYAALLGCAFCLRGLEGLPERPI